MTLLALHVYIRQKMHFYPSLALPFAHLAPPAFHVETEPPRFVSAYFRFLCRREQIANNRECARIGRGVRARGSPDRRLVHINNLIQSLYARDRVMRAGCRFRLIQLLRKRFGKDVVNKRAFCPNPTRRSRTPASQAEYSH